MKGLVLTSAVAVAAFAVAAPFETVIAPRTNETWRGAMLKGSVRQPYAADAKAVNLASFDGAGAVELLVDGALRATQRIAFHPCDNCRTVAMSTADFFERFLPGVGHEPRMVEIHDFMK